MLELGKRGQKASKLTDLLLDNAKSDNRLIRQSILLALPKIAKVPCANCEAKLDAAHQGRRGQDHAGDLNLETTMLRNYFSWAGGKTPSKNTPAAEAPAPAETPEPAKKDADQDDEKEPAKAAPAKAAPTKAPPKKKGR